jgi:hypothetical protein
MKHSFPRIVALSVSSLAAAGLSLLHSGGLIVFAGRTKGLVDVCLVYAPVLALPIALLAWRWPRLAAALWIAISAFFGAQAFIAWPRLSAVIDAYLIFSLVSFSVVGVLLLYAATVDGNASARRP